MLSFPFHPVSYFTFVSFQVILWHSYEASEYFTSYESLLIQTPLMKSAIPFSHMQNQSSEHRSPNLYQQWTRAKKTLSCEIYSCSTTSPVSNQHICVFPPEKKLQSKLGNDFNYSF